MNKLDERKAEIDRYFKWDAIVCWIGIILMPISVCLAIGMWFVWGWYSLLWLLGVILGAKVVWYSVCMTLAKMDVLRELDEG